MEPRWLHNQSRLYHASYIKSPSQVESPRRVEPLAESNSVTDLSDIGDTTISDHTVARSVAVAYETLSDDGLTWLDSFENVALNNPIITPNEIDWYSDLT